MMPAQPPQPPQPTPPSTSSNSVSDPSPATARSFTAFLVPPPLTFYVQLGNGVQLEVTPSPERLLGSLLGAGGVSTGVPIMPVVFTMPLSGVGMGSDAMQRAMHELFVRSQSEQHGPPPTSKAFLDALPLKTWDAVTCASEKYTECAICLSEYETHDQVLSLPCGHAFHKDCGMPWLVEHNVCPTCRYQMPTQESDKPAAATATATSATNAAAVASTTIDTPAASSSNNSNNTSESQVGEESTEPEEEPVFERMLRTLLGVRRERSPTFAELQPARAVRQRVDPVETVTLPGVVPASSTDADAAVASSTTDNERDSDAALDSMLEEEATRFVAEESAKRTTASAAATTGANNNDNDDDAAIFNQVDLDELLHDTRPSADSVAAGSSTSGA